MAKVLRPLEKEKY
ncbi:unnamed protein product [Lathyrus oleraceus]